MKRPIVTTLVAFAVASTLGACVSPGNGNRDAHAAECVFDSGAIEGGAGISP